MARDQATTAYVRHRIREWKHPSGRAMTDREMATLSGNKPSALNQIRSGKLGVGAIVARRLAEAWGMTYPELIATAEKWHEEHGKKALESATRAQIDDPEISEAVAQVKMWVRDVTDAEIQLALAGYQSEYFAGRDQEWWFRTLAAELEYRRRSLVHPRTAEREAEKKKAETRKTAREKAAVLAERAERERAKPSENPPHKRRKTA